MAWVYIIKGNPLLFLGPFSIPKSSKVVWGYPHHNGGVYPDGSDRISLIFFFSRNFWGWFPFMNIFVWSQIWGESECWESKGNQLDFVEFGNGKYGLGYTFTVFFFTFFFEWMVPLGMEKCGLLQGEEMGIFALEPTKSPYFIKFKQIIK